MGFSYKKGDVALAAAKKAIKTGLPHSELSEEFGISRDAISNARLILQYGTADEIEKVGLNQLAIEPTYLKIRSRLTAEQLKLFRSRTTGWSEKRRKKIGTGTDIWATFGPTIYALTSLPNPKDVVALIKAHSKRENTVNENIEVAFNWLKEFTDEWRELQRIKNSQDDNNSGVRNSTAGIQQNQ